MPARANPSRRDALAMMAALTIAGCKGVAASEDGKPDGYRWTRILDAAPYPKAYNYPVHIAADGRFVALHPAGSWSSRDGVTWTKEPLPPVPTNTAYLAAVSHRGTTVALGRHHGSFPDFSIEPRVWSTADHVTWTEAPSPNLPPLIFYAAASFAGHIWMLGGHDGRAPANQLWRSPDGLAWEAMPAPPWSPRARGEAVVFGDRLLLIGGGAVDGEPGSEAAKSEVWATRDGRVWDKLADHVGTPDPVGFVPQVYDGKLWLVGANRSGAFTSEMIVSGDARTWTPVAAPWSARGAMATWTDGKRLLITGGKSSRVEKGEIIFEYSNDVWAMERA